MKQLLLLMACLALLPAVAGSQRYEGGLEVGTVTTNNWIHGFEPDMSYHITARLHKSRGTHWQNGIRIDVEGIRANKTLDSNGVPLTGEHDAKFASPLVAFALYSNYRRTFGKLYLYFGGEVGLLACSLPENNITPYESGKGALFGIQAGGVFWLVKHVGISAEAAPRYNLVSWEFGNQTPHGDKSKESKGFFSFPVMVGVRLGMQY